MLEDEMLVKLANIFDDHTSISMSKFIPFLQFWVSELDRTEKCDSSSEMNQMHIIGAVLSVVLYRSAFKPDTLENLLGSMCSEITITDKKLCDYGWENLCDLCLSLQLEFNRLYIRRRDGYDCDVDVECLCLALMHRAGFWFAHRFRNKEGQTENIPSEALRGLVDMDAEGFCIVRTESMRHFLNAVHSMFGLNFMLHNAEFISCENDIPELSSHHVEASAEYFFTLSMTSDCKVGTIAQYAHKFPHLFHSISQVVYFNNPTYARQKQLKLQDLQKQNTPHINILPALLELYPTIPLFYEHSGAGLTSAHRKHDFSWVVWDKFIFLVTNSRRVFIADDLRTLANFFEKKEVL